jgi:superfamily II DNA/RNA helicase
VEPSARPYLQENREGTKHYLKTILEQAIERTDRAEERIEVIDGLTSSARRKEIQRRFNTDPAKDPLRILLATDAAREGLNFQAHCADLFHFDLPWGRGGTVSEISETSYCHPAGANPA